MNPIKLFIYKLTHWEYWSSAYLLLPTVPVWLYYSIRAKSLFFFNASNPRIKNAGLQNESKKEVYDLIPKKYIPKTLFFKLGTSESVVLEAMKEAGIVFPCIAKPDIGMRGMAVELIADETGVGRYCDRIPIDFLIQEFIDLPNEIGVFYYRLPSEKKGHISGVVGKEFMIVTGDGVSTVNDLIRQNPRYYMQEAALQKLHGEAGMREILPKDEQKNIMPYGSHSRGSKFIDLSDWADDQLNEVIDYVCRQIPDFYYGRLDIRFNTRKELAEARNFRIIELNGAGSDPTHIFDPRHSVFWAWKEIARHYGLLYRISKENHKKGSRYLSLKEGLEMGKEYRNIVRKLKTY